MTAGPYGRYGRRTGTPAGVTVGAVRDDGPMTTFDEFASAAPDLASAVRARFEATGLAFLGSTRADGSPRVSPFEPILHDGRLFLGSMPQAVKARDLQRDGRCAVISTLASKDDHSPEAKLFCRATEVVDLERIAEILTVAMANAGVEGTFELDDYDGSHIFELSIEGAAVQQLDDERWMTRSWRPGADVRVRQRVGASGLSEEVDVDPAT